VAAQAAVELRVLELLQVVLRVLQTRAVAVAVQAEQGRGV
jgi:hypothetical protein